MCASCALSGWRAGAQAAAWNAGDAVLAANQPVLEAGFLLACPSTKATVMQLAYWPLHASAGIGTQIWRCAAGACCATASGTPLSPSELPAGVH